MLWTCKFYFRNLRVNLGEIKFMNLSVIVNVLLINSWEKLIIQTMRDDIHEA